MENIDIKPSLQRRQKRRDKRLNEELIECYRYGGWKNGKGYRKRVQRNSFAHAKAKESIREMHGGGKWLNDNLEPLIRFLRSHVGKHWDKVYSELSQKLDKQTVSGLHVFQHLTAYVHTKVVIEDGRVRLPHLSRYRLIELVSREKSPVFYVHPKTGVLLEAKPKKRKTKPRQ